jgi:DNA-binding CsgD family transcriptional regulator
VSRRKSPAAPDNPAPACSAIPLPCAPADLSGHLLQVGTEQYALLEWAVAPAAVLDGLSPAEREVVRLALDGLSNSQIAEARATAVRTVANQLASIFRKLAIGSRLELFALPGLQPPSDG